MNGGRLVQLSDRLVALVHDDAETQRYEIIDLEIMGAEECSVGTTATLEDAYSCIEFNGLRAWQVWSGYVDEAGDFIADELVAHMPLNQQRYGR
jgi:hypothetical protein